MSGPRPHVERTTYDPIAQEGHVHLSLRLVVTDSDVFEHIQGSFSLIDHQLVAGDRWPLVERCRALDIVVYDARLPFPWGCGTEIRRRAAPRRNAEPVVSTTRVELPATRGGDPAQRAEVSYQGISLRQLWLWPDSERPSWRLPEPECRRCAQLPPSFPPICSSQVGKPAAARAPRFERS